MPPTVIDAVSKAIDGLVQNVEEGVAYDDLEALRCYVQWTLDFSAYEVALDAYRADLRNAEIQREAIATVAFREMYGRLYEEVLWDWSPIWRILCSSEELLSKLPPQPWRHDGEF